MSFWRGELLKVVAELKKLQPLDADLTSWAAVVRASGFDTFVATPSSANLRALLSDETGTGAAVFADSPTFTTQITAPLVVGGAGTGSSLSLKSTSGAGTTDFIRLLVGNNGAVESFRVDTTGNIIKGHTTALAINASSTIAGLQTHGIDAATGSWGVFCNQNSTVAPTIALVKSRGGTVGSTTVVQSGDSLGNLTFRGYDGTNPVPGATISSAVDGTPGASDMPGRLMFNTTADGASAVTERVRIDSNGFVSVLGGSFGRGTPVTKTADFTVAATENNLINNKSGSSCTVTLPTASSFTGREILINNIQAQTVVSASSNVVPRAGGAAGTAILAATAGAWALLVSDGTNWKIMAGS